MEKLETSIMSQDQHALRDAYNLVEKHGEGRIGNSKLIKKLGNIADWPGLSEQTCMVIRYVIEKCEEGSTSYTWWILFEEWEKQIRNCYAVFGALSKTSADIFDLCPKCQYFISHDTAKIPIPTDP